MDSYLAGFMMVAGVEGGLTAAGLRLWEIDFDTEVLQYLRHRNAGLRLEHIDHAGDKQGNAFPFGGLSFDHFEYASLNGYFC